MSISGLHFQDAISAKPQLIKIKSGVEVKLESATVVLNIS